MAMSYYQRVAAGILWELLFRKRKKHTRLLLAETQKAELRPDTVIHGQSIPLHVCWMMDTYTTKLNFKVGWQNQKASHF